jgi:hypothetical protein
MSTLLFSMGGHDIQEKSFLKYFFADAQPRAAIYFQSDLPIDHYPKCSFTPLNSGLAFP